MTDPRLPLFPLGIVLLPGEPVPLHIFEPRYKEMVRVCIDDDRPFGIVYASASALADVGCTARIRTVATRYDDGRLDIVAVGEDRFRVLHVHRDRAYLTTDTEPVEDADPAACGTARARQRVVARHMKLLEMAGEAVRPGLYDEPFPLSFVVGRNAGLDLDDKQALLAMDGEEERLAFLADHLGRLLMRVREAKKISTLARGDGQAGGVPEPGE
ncbi:MAG TPA: LON peptidase substrate-binding domain-containing protein [Rubricoccaceae bacterium]